MPFLGQERRVREVRIERGWVIEEARTAARRARKESVAFMIDVLFESLERLEGISNSRSVGKERGSYIYNSAVRLMVAMTPI